MTCRCGATVCERQVYGSMGLVSVVDWHDDARGKPCHRSGMPIWLVNLVLICRGGL